MIAVVDVCSGNLRSVERALEHVGGDVVVTRDAETVRRADKIVVPGQGAFGVFMRGLGERGLGDALREAIASGRPFLGICLGLQILFDQSEEQGPCAGPRSHPSEPATPVPRSHLSEPATPLCRGPRSHLSEPAPPLCRGLGVIAGNVVKISPGDARLKIPHIGWNRVHGRGDPLLRGTGEAPYVYFVHSYHAVPADPSIVVLEAEHGVPVCAAIRKDNLFACQFHPEKSQGVGLQILRNFVEAS